MEAKIKEIFSSIQGEGPIVGYKQLFIRFCGCNLDCNYCDTDFDIKDANSYTPYQLAEKISKEYDLSSFHSISLTGGEPLVNDLFIKDFLQELKKLSDIKIYLETNATLYDKLDNIKDLIDIISADIKLETSTGRDTFELHEKFLTKCKGIFTFAKIVFDENITEEEIRKCIQLGKINNIELILQPKMDGNKLSVSSDFCENIMEKFTSQYHKVRLIPQTHKFLNVR